MEDERRVETAKGFPRIAVVVQSEDDMEGISPGLQLLRGLGDKGVVYDLQILSPMRTPKELVAYVEQAEKDGVVVFIAVSGGANVLASMIAAHVIAPVIALPMQEKAGPSYSGEMGAVISPLATPPGYPIATVGIGHVENAFFMAAQFLSGRDASRRILQDLEKYRERLKARTLAANKEIVRE